jgi:fibronectin type 3 domain-containing protein
VNTQGQTISYVQSAYATPQTAVASVAVTFPSAQTAGDLNVVVVGWNDSTATVSQITDKSGNTYTRAVGPTVQSGLATQSIYYAKNIASAGAGANTVTVTFAIAAAYPDIRILEYRGADTVNPVDVTGAAQGNSASASSGSATTTSATDLIFGANLVQTTTAGAGASFTRRLVTLPDGDIAEDRMVAAMGSYSATAPVSPSGGWIMQMVAFRTPTGAPPPPPTVSGVNPSSGSTAGGTVVTVSGANFGAPASVTFGGAAATNVTVVNSTTITATTPAGAAGVVTVTVTVSGQNGSLTNGFTYVAPPTVSGVNPNTGPTTGGTAVTITGSNFAAGAGVTFGAAAAANVTVVNSTTITATTAAGGAGAVTATVTNSNGVSGSLANAFTYVGPPTVSGVNPSSGPTAGGTPVTITGTGFASGAGVTFRTAAATNVTVVNGTTITATTPAGSAGAATVTVTVGGQSGSLTNGFTYGATSTIGFVQGNYATPQSSQSSVSVAYPAAQKAGDLNVVVVGWNDSVATVTGVKDSSGNQYALAVGPTVQSPVASQAIYYAKNIAASAAGANSVTVTFSTAAAYPDIRIVEYSGADPNNPVDVTAAASGNSATSASGSATTTNPTDLIFGANLVQTTTGGPGSGFTTRMLTSPDGDIVEDQMVAAVGAYSAMAPVGAGQWIMQMVAFRTPGGTPPTVSGVSPNSGPATGGTNVTIAGGNFAAGAAVSFGGVAATNVVVVNGATITATTPAGAGAATVMVTNPGGLSGSLAGGFTYIAPPTVSGVAPNGGPMAGGTAVTIAGSNFAAGASVKFGGAAATNVAVVNAATITATTPAGSAGAVTVTVTNTNGLSGSLAGGYTYLAPPTVTGVAPNSGPTTGGTAVTIAGSNFATGATVTFGAAAATNVAVANSTTITATAPAGAAGAATVTVTVSAQSGSLTNGFTYVVAPTVTGVGPNSGPTTGGTAVTITGANFAAGASVTFGAAAATNVAVVNASTITATSPAGGPGAATVTVTVNGQNGSLTSGFTYIAPPTVSSVNPNTGLTAGGTGVTITGANFASGATVTFAAAPATNVAVVNSTTITATTPPGSAGTVTVTVTNPGPQSGSLANAYTYATAPTPTAPTNLTTGAGPSPSYVSGQGYYNATSLTSHTTAAFDSTGGDLLLLFASSHQGVTFTPSDNFGNSWISIAGPTSTTAGFDLRSQVWYAPTPIVGPGQTITMNLSLSQPLVMSVVVLKGSNVSSPVDAISLIGSDNGTSTLQVASPNLNTINLNDLLVGFAKTNGNESFAAGPGFTLQAASTVSNLTAETQPVAAAGSYDATLTLSSGVTWQSVVAAAATNPNQTILSWTASTETGGAISQYLIERCQGVSCNSFAQIGATTATSFNDANLAASTNYSYRVRAQDTANTLGPYSGVVTITMPAPIPSLPGNLTAATASPTQINLAWTPSTEAGGSVASYLVERCQGANCTNFAQVGSSLTTTFNDTGLTSSTSYSYRVRALDGSGNASPYSNVASAGSGNVPTDPSNLTATAISPTQINLAWTASTEAGGTVTGYLIERCQGAGCSNFSRLLTVPSNSYSDTGLAPSTSYTYHVKATDANGNFSNYSNLATTTTPAQGTVISFIQGNYATPQSAPSSVSVTFTGAQAAGDLNVVVVGWNNSTATVSQITDTSGNAYVLAVGPTVQSPVASQSIYYAKNIAGAPAGGNTVKVIFSGAAAYPDIRILEYSGADTNSPVDAAAAASGNSALSASGTATTTNPDDLIFGANLVQTSTGGPGSGFTARFLTSPDGDIAEDEMVTAVGAYSATAPIGSGQWIMQMVAFRAAPPPNTPSVKLSRTNINFGNGQTGITSSPQPVTLTNIGTAQLTINSILVSGGNSSDFAQTNNCGATLASNSACTINVTFTPTNTGARSSTIAINDNAPGSPQSIALSGTGTGFSITPSVSVLTFTETQQFTASGGSPSWAVDGIVGGSATVGTITSAGLYTPPSTVGTHTITATLSSQSASSTLYVTNYGGTFTHHNDNLRTGQNSAETVLTPANVNQTQFGKLFSYPVDGYTYASPLYVPNVNIPGQGAHNVVYVATEHDSVFAFDAEGLSGNALWGVTFLSSGVTTVPCGDTGECGDIPNEIGITGTPVVDPASGTLYVVAKTKENGVYVQRLHALDIATGAEKFGGPVALQATVSGSGAGSSGGNLAFDPLRENQRPALLLNNGVVYIAFASHGDQNPWHGWVLGYNATTLQRTFAFSTTPDGYGGGIWQSGGGLAADAGGNVFFAAGNGDFSANTGGRNYADSVVKLSAAGSVVDYFTPHDQATMESTNIELGSAGPVLLIDQTTGPYPHVLVTAAKNGVIYVVNRDNLGHYNPNNDNQIIQSLNVLPHSDDEHGNYSSPAYFNGYIYFGAVSDVIRAFQFTNGQMSANPTSQSTVSYPNRGSSFAISANGTTNGVLWAMQDNSPGNGVLYAYDAGNLANELYDSSQAGSRDALDVANKFNIPLVANGKVFIVSQTQLIAYGLLP